VTAGVGGRLPAHREGLFGCGQGVGATAQVAQPVGESGQRGYEAVTVASGVGGSQLPADGNGFFQNAEGIGRAVLWGSIIGLGLAGLVGWDHR